ncbi:MAG: hypothetical protein ACYDHH_03420 [Solirubrobacteraceae bacterium]
MGIEAAPIPIDSLTPALPGGADALRASVWEFIRPMLSTALTDLNRDAFVSGSSIETTVDLERHRATSDITSLRSTNAPTSTRRDTRSSLDVVPPATVGRTSGT